MASNEKATPVLKAGTVTPPPVSSGRKAVVPPELCAAVYAAIHGTGEWGTVTDGDGNPVTFDGDKGRQRASTMATRVKKALVNSPDTEYKDPKAVKSRVWEAEDGKFVFAVIERDGDSAD